MKPDTDTSIIKALRSGLTTSTEIAEHLTRTGDKLTVAQTQVALTRLMDHGRVVRTRTAVGYEWKAVST